jgi:hypothetical protein
MTEGKRPLEYAHPGILAGSPRRLAWWEWFLLGIGLFVGPVVLGYLLIAVTSVLLSLCGEP